MNGNHLQRLQRYWDARAAGNFVFGGAGSGLVAYAALCAADATMARVLVALGLALVGAGLVCVWLEIGRPLRAFNVFVHWRRSWMSREAVAAAVLMPLGGAFVLGIMTSAVPAALVALVFLVCQANILGAARAIPAWRGRSTTALLITAGLAEGAGLFWLISGWSATGTAPLLAFAALLAVRGALWESWRVRMRASAAPAVSAQASRLAPWMRWIGAALPLAAVVLASATPAFAGVTALAGALVVATGAVFKFVLITRLSFHHGYSLPHMPVRGVPRTAPH